MQFLSSRARRELLWTSLTKEKMLHIIAEDISKSHSIFGILHATLKCGNLWDVYNDCANSML